MNSNVAQQLKTWAGVSVVAILIVSALLGHHLYKRRVAIAGENEWRTNQANLADMVAKYRASTNWFDSLDATYSFQVQAAFAVGKDKATVSKAYVHDIVMKDDQFSVKFDMSERSFECEASCSSGIVERLTALESYSPIYAVFMPTQLLRVEYEMTVIDYDTAIEGSGDDQYAYLKSSTVGVRPAYGRYVVRGTLLDFLPVVYKPWRK